MIMSREQGILEYIESNYDESIRIFTNLIESNDDIYINLCNRSACYIKLRKYKEALDDCKQVLKYNQTWAKAWGRLGASLYGLSQYNNAKKAYIKASELEPTNQIYKNMISIISSNDMITSIISSNEMKDILNDNSFKMKVLSYSSNPFGALKDKDIMNKINNILDKLKFINNF